MKCEQTRKLLIDLMYGGLKESDESQTREHLNNCPSCMQEYQDMENVLNRYRKTEFGSPSDHCIDRIISAANDEIRKNNAAHFSIGYKAAAAVFLAGFTGLLLYVCTADFTAVKKTGADNDRIAMLKKVDKLRQDEQSGPTVSEEVARSVDKNKEHRKSVIKMPEKADRGSRPAGTMTFAESSRPPESSPPENVRTPTGTNRLEASSKRQDNKTVSAKQIIADAESGSARSRTAHSGAPQAKGGSGKRAKKTSVRPAAQKDKTGESFAVLSEYEESVIKEKAVSDKPSTKEDPASSRRLGFQKFGNKSVSESKQAVSKSESSATNGTRKRVHEPLKRFKAADAKQQSETGEETGQTNDKIIIEFAKAYSRAKKLYNAGKHKQAIAELLKIEKRPGYKTRNKFYKRHHLILLGKCYKRAGMEKKKESVARKLNREHYFGRNPNVIENELRAEEHAKSKILKQQQEMDTSKQ